MFRKLSVRDFQRHRKLSVEFDDHVTVIVGDTDKGKSALIRALFFLCLNKLSGGTAAYVRKGKSGFSVTLDVDDHTVTRKKSSGNVYLLNGNRLCAVGKAPVPPDVAKLLNVSPINFQRQLDAHFWFSDSPGQVAKNLNEIVNLELIDSTLQRTAAHVRNVKSKVELCEERYADAKERKEALAWVPAFCSAAYELDQLSEKRRQFAQDASQIHLLVRKAQSAARTVKMADGAVYAGMKAVAAGQHLAKAVKDRKRLEKLIHDVQRASVLVEQAVPDLGPLLDLRARADRTAEARRELEYLIEDAVKAGEEICRREKELEKSQARLRRLAKNRRCPECGRKFPSGYSPGTSTCHTDRRYSGR